MEAEKSSKTMLSIYKKARCLGHQWYYSLDT